MVRIKYSTHRGLKGLDKLVAKMTHKMFDSLVKETVRGLMADPEVVGAAQYLVREAPDLWNALGTGMTYVDLDYTVMADVYARLGADGVYTYLYTEGIVNSTNQAHFIFNKVFLPEWTIREKGPQNARFCFASVT